MVNVEGGGDVCGHLVAGVRRRANVDPPPVAGCRPKTSAARTVAVDSARIPEAHGFCAVLPRSFGRSASSSTRRNSKGGVTQGEAGKCSG